MATAHLHRLWIIIPAARRTALNNWCRNNLDPTGGDWFTAGLNALGTGVATHYWCSAAFTNAQLRLIIIQLLGLASITLPADWDTKTRAEKRAWLNSQKTAIQTATGIRLQHSLNDGAWDNPVTERQALALLVITA